MYSDISSIYKDIKFTLVMFSGQNENVLVTHIQNPCKFMVQLKKDSSKLAVMSHGLQQFCNSPAAKQHMVTGVDVGMFFSVFLIYLFEPCHDKTNIMGLRPAWIPTSLPIRIHAVH
jgi:hypothetical protein